RSYLLYLSSLFAHHHQSLLLFFCFFLILRPPISTLFPYTTLFRSHRFVKIFLKGILPFYLQRRPVKLLIPVEEIPHRNQKIPARSEERRVGKEWRARRERQHRKEKRQNGGEKEVRRACKTAIHGQQ